MRKARVFVNNIDAGILEELPDNHYQFSYLADYKGPPVSLTMPMQKSIYLFKQFPCFFEGLLPEGLLLESLLKKYKLDRDDYFGQLIQVGRDAVGAVSIEEIK